VNLVCELTREEMDPHREFSLLTTSCVWSELDQSEMDKDKLEPGI